MSPGPSSNTSKTHSAHDSRRKSQLSPDYLQLSPGARMARHPESSSQRTSNHPGTFNANVAQASNEKVSMLSSVPSRTFTQQLAHPEKLPGRQVFSLRYPGVSSQIGPFGRTPAVHIPPQSKVVVLRKPPCDVAKPQAGISFSPADSAKRIGHTEPSSPALKARRFGEARRAQTLSEAIALKPAIKVSRQRPEKSHRHAQNELYDTSEDHNFSTQEQEKGSEPASEEIRYERSSSQASDDQSDLQIPPAPEKNTEHLAHNFMMVGESTDERLRSQLQPLPLSQKGNFHPEYQADVNMETNSPTPTGAKLRQSCFSSPLQEYASCSRSKTVSGPISEPLPEPEGNANLAPKRKSTFEGHDEPHKKIFASSLCPSSSPPRSPSLPKHVEAKQCSLARGSTAHLSIFSKDDAKRETMSTLEELKTLFQKADRTLRENFTTVEEISRLEVQIATKDKEMHEYKCSMKNLVAKFSKEKSVLDKGYSDMKAHVSSIKWERKHPLISSKEVASFRKEIAQSLEACHSLTSGRCNESETDIRELDNMDYNKLTTARKAVLVAKELDEDRQKKQMVIDILRKELELKTGQVTEMHERISELEKALSFQWEDKTNLEKIREQEIQTLKNQLKESSELILESLKEKDASEKQELQSKIQSLKTQLISKEEIRLRISNDLKLVQARLQEETNVLDVERKRNDEQMRELSRKSNELSVLEGRLASTEALQDSISVKLTKQEETISELTAQKITLQLQNRSFSQSTEEMQESLTIATRECENLREGSRLQDDLTARLESRGSELKTTQSKLSAITDKFNQLRDDHTELLARNDYLATQVTEGSSRIQKLMERLEDSSRLAATQSASGEVLRTQNLELRAKIQSIDTESTKMKQDYMLLEKKAFLKEKELERSSGFELQCKQLEEKASRLLEAQEKELQCRKDLQNRLDCTQQKWEDLKSREDVATGQVAVLQEKLTEAKGNQMSLNREAKAFKEKISELQAENNELKLVGESRSSKEAIKCINARLEQEIDLRKISEDKMVTMQQTFDKSTETNLEKVREIEKRFEGDKEGLNRILVTKQTELSCMEKQVDDLVTANQQLRRSLIDEERKNVDLSWVKTLYEDEKKRNLLLQSAATGEANTFQARLKTAQEQLEASHSELAELKGSNNEQAAKASWLLHQAEKKASESRKEAAAAARKEARETLEQKYELRLMHSNNEIQKITHKLNDAESRLLAMSAELAKSRGKPSLEETFSSSQNEPSPRAQKNESSSHTMMGAPESEPSFERNRPGSLEALRADATAKTGGSRASKRLQVRDSITMVGARADVQNESALPKQEEGESVEEPKAIKHPSVRTAKSGKRQNTKKKSNKPLV